MCRPDGLSILLYSLTIHYTRCIIRCEIMNYIVAVSGGVDSVVLLDIMHKKISADELIVAHFDHGIREDSSEDALFVEALAASLGLKFISRREELGADASEALARERRYEFLNSLKTSSEDILVTAHHKDDLVETVAINLMRGTGWRGLAVLDSGVSRPLLDMTKLEILDYALRNGLEWREDSTNYSDAYLRNRLRSRARLLEEPVKKELSDLRFRQVEIKNEIDNLCSEFALSLSAVSDSSNSVQYPRYFFSQIPDPPAIEVLRNITEARLTRPQLRKLLLAVKTHPVGAKYSAGDGIVVTFTTRYFSL